MTYLSSDIARIKDEIRKCEREGQVLNQDFNEAHVKVEDLDKEYTDAKTEYEALYIKLFLVYNPIRKREATTLNHQIDAINQDIAALNSQLRTIDEVIAKSKINKTNAGDHTNNTFYAGSLFANDSVVQPDSVLQSTIDNNPQKTTHYKGMRGAKKPGEKNANVAKDEKGSGSCNLCNIF